MEKKTEVRAVELVRRIRDQQAELLKGKSDKEIIEFFRKAGEAWRKRAAGKGRVANDHPLESSRGRTGRG